MDFAIHFAWLPAASRIKGMVIPRSVAPFHPAARIPACGNAAVRPVGSILPGGDAPDRSAGGTWLDREAADSSVSPLRLGQDASDRTVYPVPPGQSATNRTVCPSLPGQNASDRTVFVILAKNCETYSHTGITIFEQNGHFQSNSPKMRKNRHSSIAATRQSAAIPTPIRSKLPAVCRHAATITNQPIR